MIIAIGKWNNKKDFGTKRVVFENEMVVLKTSKIFIRLAPIKLPNAKPP